MNLIRLILIAAVVWLVFVLLKRWLGGMKPSRQGPAPRPDERMVKCAYCGTHVPESQALRRGPHYYCCAEHRDGHGG